MKKTVGDLEFDSLQINETAHLFAEASKPACNIVINFSYPTHSTDELLIDTLNYYFIKACFGEKYSLKTPQEVTTQYVDNYIKNYRTDLEPLYLQDEKDIVDGSDIASWYSYYENIESNVQFYDKGLLVYRVQTNEYTGGAHGNYATNYLNIDLALMRPLPLDDVFVGDYQENILNMKNITLFFMPTFFCFLFLQVFQSFRKDSFLFLKSLVFVLLPSYFHLFLIIIILYNRIMSNLKYSN